MNVARALPSLLAILAGCGALNGSTPTDGKPGGTGTATSGIDCPTEQCRTGERCCAVPGSSQVFACAAACASPADELACLRPSDCGGATPTCCARATVTGSGLVTASTCALGTVGTVCTTAASCPTNVTATCASTEEGPLCSAAADCTAGNSCCSLTIAGATFSGCVSTDLAQLGGLVCM